MSGKAHHVRGGAAGAYSKGPIVVVPNGQTLTIAYAPRLPAKGRGGADSEWEWQDLGTRQPLSPEKMF